MSSFTNVVIIDRDPANLETHLAEQFPGKIFQVRQEIGARSHCPDDDEVNTYVRELVSGDGWTQLVD